MKRFIPVAERMSSFIISNSELDLRFACVIMNHMKKVISILLVLIVFCGCSKQTRTEKVSEVNKDVIKHMKKQKWKSLYIQNRNFGTVFTENDSLLKKFEKKGDVSFMNIVAESQEQFDRILKLTQSEKSSGLRKNHWPKIDFNTQMIFFFATLESDSVSFDKIFVENDKENMYSYISVYRQDKYETSKKWFAWEAVVVKKLNFKKKFDITVNYSKKQDILDFWMPEE